MKTEEAPRVANAHEKEQVPSVGCGALFGVLTRAGSIIVNEEADCAVIVSMTREELQAVKYLPMYRRVAVVRADELERLDRYCSALEEQLDSIGLQKAQHIAGLSSPNDPDEPTRTLNVE